MQAVMERLFAFFHQAAVWLGNLFQQVLTWWEAHPFYLGLALAALLAAQLLLMLAGTVQQLFYQRRQRQFEGERLRLLIKAATVQCQEAQQAQLLWSGHRKFRVQKTVCEAVDVHSFYLLPHDGRPLPAFKPGQYLTFRLKIPGQDKPVVRCYSLSDSPNHLDYYRVTIKKEKRTDGKYGVASSYFCDVVKEGAILYVKAPAGKFNLDVEQERPVVLIGAGVGVTPVLSMLNAIVDSGAKRETWFFFGVRNRIEHIRKDHLEKIARETDNVHLHTCYSRPEETDRPDVDYKHAGRLCIDLFEKILPSFDFDYYICGPAAMMESMVDGLKARGVPSASIFYEAFNSSSVKVLATPPVTPAEALKPLQVDFSKSGKVCKWPPALGQTVLELADENGVVIDSGCRAGSC